MSSKQSRHIVSALDEPFEKVEIISVLRDLLLIYVHQSKWTEADCDNIFHYVERLDGIVCESLETGIEALLRHVFKTKIPVAQAFSMNVYASISRFLEQNDKYSSILNSKLLSLVPLNNRCVKDQIKEAEVSLRYVSEKISTPVSREKTLMMFVLLFNCIRDSIKDNKLFLIPKYVEWIADILEQKYVPWLKDNGGWVIIISRGRRVSLFHNLVKVFNFTSLSLDTMQSIISMTLATFLQFQMRLK